MGTKSERVDITMKKGRWPANLVHDGSDEVLAGFPQTQTHSTGKNSPSDYPSKSIFGAGHKSGVLPYAGDSGSAARFFYCAKASRAERNAGLEGSNGHPTVKPLALMEYLCKLTKTPTGGVVLDPFMGSGTTGVACAKTGRDFIGIEKDEHYCEIARRRIVNEQKQGQMGLFEQAQKGGE
jgi:site-specific DNA-methyltransferase (adenine-specific)